MITPSEMEQRRSPRGLREFVGRFKDAVQADEPERHRGIQKKGLYKEFLDELVPLSCFAVCAYHETYEVELVLGNQQYDAVVFSETGEEVDRIQITTPHDGTAAAIDAKRVVGQGYGQIHVGNPGEDFDALFPHVLATCRRKAQNDYSDCTLGGCHRANAALPVVRGAVRGADRSACQRNEEDRIQGKEGLSPRPSR
ncbi:MAG: hypothetical protein IIC76_03735 [Bacteroidetes bacterium]|nr:hypothetical protein [Bacteroidota bacterium]